MSLAIQTFSVVQGELIRLEMLPWDPSRDTQFGGGGRRFRACRNLG